QRDLAEDLAGIDHVEDDLAAVRRGRADAHLAGEHRHHAGARRGLVEDDVAVPVMRDMGMGKQLVDFAARQLSEESVVAQYRPAVYGSTCDHAVARLSPIMVKHELCTDYGASETALLLQTRGGKRWSGRQRRRSPVLAQE